MLILHALAIPFSTSPPHGDQNSHHGPETNPAIPKRPGLLLDGDSGGHYRARTSNTGRRLEPEAEGRRLVRYHGALRALLVAAVERLVMKANERNEEILFPESK